MNSRWYKEDRKLPSSEQAEAIKETKKALENSTLMSRLLKGIIEEEIEGSYADEECYGQNNYALMCVFNAGKRKALRDIMKLLP